MDAKSQRCGMCMHYRDVDGGMCLVYGGHVKADEHHVNVRSAITSDVARSLGFVRVVPCFDCAYQGTHDCPAKDSAECMAFCSRGRKRDDDQR